MCRVIHGTFLKGGSMKILTIRLCAACIFLIVASDASAARPRSRQIQGTIESVKLENRELTIHSERNVHEQFVWTKQTKFIQGGQFTEAASLPTGVSVQVNYRSPFFGRKFVTKVKWNSDSTTGR